ncbi:MAG: hypothetical protein QOH93_2102, partial [Chloroflexia bacterium]|nr:hypothetical protein [Chloroflexia bacterium]
MGVRISDLVAGSQREKLGYLSLLLAAALVLLVGLLPRFPSTATLSPTPTPTPQSEIPIPKSKIGLHTRLTDEPNPENIRQEFRMLHEMGGSYATEFFPWAYIQPHDRNRFDWEH